MGMGRFSSAVHGYGVPALLSAFFLLSYFVAQNGHNISLQQSSQLAERSVSIEHVKRADGSYVIIPVTYDLIVRGELDANLYTDVLFGYINMAHVTWVPKTPSSRNEFCNQAKNGPGCQIAGKTGYYSPRSTTGNAPSFEVSQETSSNYTATATGRWYSDSVTIAGITVDLQFGVADYWNTTPTLGLGVFPRYADSRRPSYLTVLKQQGQIGDTVCSVYDSGNSTVGGSLLLGAVDRAKFTGKFKVWDDGSEYPGDVPVPNVRFLNSTSEISPDSNGVNGSLATIYPSLPAIYVPQVVIDSIAAPPNGLYYDVPCDWFNPDEDFLEFTWQELVIKMPLADLLFPYPGTTADQNSCFVSIFANTEVQSGYYTYVLGQPFLKSAYVVMNPVNNLTAMAVSNRDVTTQNIVELGGSLASSIGDIQGIAPATTTAPPPPPPPPPSESSGTPVGPIVGGVVGGVAALAAVIGGIFFFRRRRRPAAVATPPEMPPPAPPGPVSELGSPDPRNDWGAPKKVGIGADGATHPVEYAEAPGHPLIQHTEPTVYAELPGSNGIGAR
ncbi:Barrierpepsin [Drechslerella dactyloides]|uniref:Barrierpepsin n=1 Tax=Drechslerella dactyloides TaxID=74499 RepID=A0AAD6IQ02_DREDA|nr:Barrierpepsin [Drechslerella dactyloides]